MTATFYEVTHPMLAKAAHDDLARELFNRSLTMFLEAEHRPRIRDVYERSVRPALSETLGHAPTRREIAGAMRAHPANAWWYALRTRSQRTSYEIATKVVGDQMPDLMRRAESLNGTCGGTLTLDPAVTVPNYIAGDIHLLEGGYHTERRTDDIAAGAIFDRQMTLNRMGAQGRLNDDPGNSLAAWVMDKFPQLKPKRILEIGCSVGHSLLPFKAAFPEAEVVGIDVAAPCLRYAHALAEGLGVPAHFVQQNAEQTNFEDGSFDLVFSRILLHETSRKALPRIFAECFRLLRKGGVMFHSDAPQYDELDPYVASLRDWDITCNNEPFMEVAYDLPLERMYAEAGFDAAACFRDRAPSQLVRATGVDPKLMRSGGSMFLTGATK